MDTQIAGLIALYAVVELVKWFVPQSQKKLDDLHAWHSKTDDDGRPLWYVPRDLGIQQKDMLEMLRDIAKYQESTARVLTEILSELKEKE